MKDARFKRFLSGFLPLLLKGEYKMTIAAKKLDREDPQSDSRVEARELFEKYHRKLITWEQFQAMLAQGLATEKNDGDNLEHKPVVKLFTPDAGCTWLLCELNPDDPLIAFGLCDLGLGFPEMGMVSFIDLLKLRDASGCSGVVRDDRFKPTMSLVRYWEWSKRFGSIPF